MKSIFILLCTIVCHQVYAQEHITQADLYGEWVCREVKVVAEDPDMKEAGEIMKPGFLNAHFVFGKDGMFHLILPKGASAPVREMLFLDNRKWFFFPEKAMIHNRTTPGKPGADLYQDTKRLYDVLYL